MAKSVNSKDKHEIVVEELDHFKKLIERHKKLLAAIGNL